MRLLKPILLVLLISSILVSCEKVKELMTSKKTKASKTVVVLFDLSGSTKGVRDTYSKSFEKIISSIDHGDVVVAAKITESSITEPEIPVKESFPEFIPRDKMGNPTDNEFLIREAKKEADARLKKRRDELIGIVRNFLFTQSAKKTEILSSLHAAERIFRNYPRDKNILIIMSDMVENSSEYNFEREDLTDKRIDEIIKIEKAKNRIPDLKAIKVYAVAAGLRDSKRFSSIQKFWLRYFKECGANLSKEHYGSALLEFDE